MDLNQHDANFCEELVCPELSVSNLGFKSSTVRFSFRKYIQRMTLTNPENHNVEVSVPSKYSKWVPETDPTSTKTKLHSPTCGPSNCWDVPQSVTNLPTCFPWLRKLNHETSRIIALGNCKTTEWGTPMHRYIETPILTTLGIVSFFEGSAAPLRAPTKQHCNCLVKPFVNVE